MVYFINIDLVYFITGSQEAILYTNIYQEVIFRQMPSYSYVMTISAAVT